jgi:hypothetical protein
LQVFKHCNVAKYIFYSKNFQKKKEKKKAFKIEEMTYGNGGKHDRLEVRKDANFA